MAKKKNSSVPAPAILTPKIDFLFSGGLSILLMGTFIIYAFFWAPRGKQTLDLSEILLFSILINAPHFIASYPLLYRSKHQRERHKMASLFVPALLIIYGLFALVQAQMGNIGYAQILELIAIIYLAWHYTGQAWGMTAVFCYINGVKMNGIERFLIRLGPRLFLVWHVLWAFYVNDLPMRMPAPILNWLGPDFPHQDLHIWIGKSYLLVLQLSILTFVAGVFGFFLIWQRTGLKPPWRAIISWAALYVWYFLMHLFPLAIFWVQIAHALQYLGFPLRVEINRFALKKNEPPEKKKYDPRGWLFFFSWVLIGFFVFQVTSWFFRNMMWEHGPSPSLFLLLISIITLSMDAYGKYAIPKFKKNSLPI